jgi:hypothetical protein
MKNFTHQTLQPRLVGSSVIVMRGHWPQNVPQGKVTGINELDKKQSSLFNVMAANPFKSK